MEKYVITTRLHERNTISSFLGISATVATLMFFLLCVGIQVANPSLTDGSISFGGDTTLLNFIIFIIGASLLVGIQSKLTKTTENHAL